jgi:hypothetical protein
VKEKIDDLLSWGHEIWHVLAALTLGVPRWAMTYSRDQIEIPYQIGRWRFVIIGLAPFAVFFTATVVSIIGWYEFTAVLPPLEIARDWLVEGRHTPRFFVLSFVYLNLHVIWLHLVILGLCFLHSTWYDVFVGLPYTWSHYDELRPMPKATSGMGASER